MHGIAVVVIVSCGQTTFLRRCPASSVGPVSFAAVVSHLDSTRVVAIVTRRADGSRVATPIWAVVIDGVPYLRSAYGETSWWYRHVVAGRETEIVLADGSIAERDRAAALDLPAERIGLEAVPADDAVQASIDEALWKKYADEPPAVEEMLTPRALACTLRVVPPSA